VVSKYFGGFLSLENYKFLEPRGKVEELMKKYVDLFSKMGKKSRLHV